MYDEQIAILEGEWGDFGSGFLVFFQFVNTRYLCIVTHSVSYPTFHRNETQFQLCVFVSSSFASRRCQRNRRSQRSGQRCFENSCDERRGNARRGD